MVHKLQPGGLKGGLRKDFLNGETEYEAGIPPGDFFFFFWIRTPSRQPDFSEGVLGKR